MFFTNKPEVNTIEDYYSSKIQELEFLPMKKNGFLNAFTESIKAAPNKTAVQDWDSAS